MGFASPVLSSTIPSTGAYNQEEIGNGSSIIELPSPILAVVTGHRSSKDRHEGRGRALDLPFLTFGASTPRKAGRLHDHLWL